MDCEQCGGDLRVAEIDDEVWLRCDCPEGLKLCPTGKTPPVVEEWLNSV